MDDKLKKVIERIKKCLALAQSDNPNEAATAMRQAQKLMREHNLTESSLHISNIVEHKVKYGNGARRAPSWMNFLTAVCAKAFDCQCVINTFHIENYKEVTYIGLGEAPKMAQYAYEVLARQLNDARNKYVKDQRKYYERVPRKLANSFALGWVNSISNKVDQLKVNDEPLETSNEKALVKVAENIVQEYMEKAYKNLKKLGKSKDQIDLDAYFDGEREGKKANLYRPMNDKSETTPLLTNS